MPNHFMRRFDDDARPWVAPAGTIAASCRWHRESRKILHWVDAAIPWTDGRLISRDSLPLDTALDKRKGHRLCCFAGRIHSVDKEEGFMFHKRWLAMFWIGALGCALGLSSCSSEGGKTASSGACTNDLCGSGGNGSSSGSGTGGTTSSSTGSGSCIEAWVCTSWDSGGNGDVATRTCTDTNACGTTTSKPIEMATLPALDFGYFQCNVEPILDRKCSMIGCHGTEQGRAFRVYARGRLRHAGEMLADAALCGGQVASAGCTGSISCPCTAKHTTTEWQLNYDSARGFAIDDMGNPITAAMADTSELIAQPVVGGKAHAGIHLFKKGDPDYQAIHTWLTSAGMNTPCTLQFN